MPLAHEPVRAPALHGSAWLNVAAPLTWEQLRGKLVLLDFWTYGCINCLHVLEELRALELKYADQPFVVIGVHSAKFANEQDDAHIREAIGRYDIHHPVVVDENKTLWDAYGVRGWPTLVLIDPQGYLLGTVSGEGHVAQLDAAIAQALTILGEDGLLSDQPLPLRLEANLTPTTPLRFPGKVLADPTRDRLFIADSGYHRIVVTTLAGEWIDTFGTGYAGAADGPADEASFHTPQGLALGADGSLLYVADTNNHRIRQIDLAARMVTTIAGTGAQNRVRFPHGSALATALNSPWDLARQGDALWIAMAGQHQIWRLALAMGTIQAVIGSSGEGRQDGAGIAAALAQPSGLALSADEQTLYFADSESSCIRMVDLADPALPVTTLAGGDLFDFGLRDGVGDEARLQHPLGVVAHNGYLYIADTYNHAIRRLNLATRKVQTVAGNGTAGSEDGPGRAAHFFEPGGITIAGDTLYVADTNNHAIRLVNTANGTVTTRGLREVCAPGFCLP